MLKRFFLRSEFAKNVFTLVTGTSLAQLIPLIIAPVLSRLYSPDQFGLLATLMSVVSAVAVIVCFRYEIAIIIPNKDEEANYLVILSFIVTIIISFLSLVATIIISFSFIENPLLKFWIYLLPIMIFLSGISQILNNYGNRLRKYSTIAKYRFLNSLSVSGINIGMGAMKFQSLGLLIGWIFGNLLSLIYLFANFVNEIKYYIKNYNLKKIIEVAKKYDSFPKTNSLQALSDMFQVNGIIYLIAFFFNQAVVGIYSLTGRVLQIPMNLIGSSIAQVFYQQASHLFNNGETLNVLVKQTIIRSSFIGLPVLLLLLFQGPALFALVFGENWREAGVYAQVLSPWIFLDFIRSPISQVSIVINKQNKLFLLSLVGNVILILCLLYGGFTKNVLSGLYLFSFLQSIWVLIIIIWIYKLSSENSFR